MGQIQRRCQAGRGGGLAKQEALAQIATQLLQLGQLAGSLYALGGGGRITSYNVCYTKLLRALHPADLWLDYGDGHYPGLDSQPLLDEVLLPVCSPAYAQQMGLLADPGRLADCLLLHDVESIRQSDPHSEWRGWLAAAGLPADLARQHYSFTSYNFV